MKLTIEIQCDNDAFQESISEEILTMLEVIRIRIETNGVASLDGAPIFDYNGNTVGAISFAE